MALPAITAHFRLALGDVQWLVICYVLVYGSLMLVCGKLGDLFGHRLIFRIGMLISAIGCAACAAAPDWPLFLLARAGQGVGTALAMSCTPALATSLFPESSRTRALAGLGMAMSLAAVIGPFLGGILVELWGWPAVYWVRVPIALIALALSGLLPSPKPSPRPFDAVGAGLLALFMSTLLLSIVLSQRREAPALGSSRCSPSSLAVLVVYVRRARHVAEPIIRPGAVRRSRLRRSQRHERARQPGGLLHPPAHAVLPGECAEAVGGDERPGAGAGLRRQPDRCGVSARLVARIGQRPTAFAGVAVVGLGLLPLGLTGVDAPVTLVALLLLAQGVGHGLLAVAYTDIVTSTLEARDRGVGGSLAQLTRTLGTVSGAALLTALHAAARRAVGDRRLPRGLSLCLPRGRRRPVGGAGAVACGSARLVQAIRWRCSRSGW